MLTATTDKILAALGPSAPATLTAFARAVGRQLRPLFVAQHSAGDAAGLVTAAFRNAEGRGRDDIAVAAAVQSNGVAVLTTSMPDQPFIVDTVRLAVEAAGGTYTGGFNAVFPVSRDGAGALVGVDAPGGAAESITLLLAEGLDAAGAAALAAEVRRRLGLARRVVADFQAMVDQVDAAAFRFSRVADRAPDQGDALRESAEFLRWLLADNFVLMGVSSEEGALGILAAPAAEWDGAGALSWPGAAGPITVRKGALPSAVHRAGRMDEIRVESPAGNGPAKVLILQGLFTYRAVTQPSRSVPILRRTLAELLRNQDSRPGSYRYKGLANAFDSLPTEYLLSASADDALRAVEVSLDAELERDARTAVLPLRTGRGAFVLLALPRDQWSDRLRADVAAAVQARLAGHIVDKGVYVGRYQTMLAHFYEGGAVPDAAAIQAVQQEVAEIARPWQDRTWRAIAERMGEPTADHWIQRYANAFDDIYRQTTAAERTARDIEMLERLSPAHPVEVDLFRDARGRLNLRIYEHNDILLSDILPVLDHFGLVIEDQDAFEVRPQGAGLRIIDTFRVQGAGALDADAVMAQGGLLVEALKAVFEQRMPDDVFNRILLPAAVPWQAVDLLRAYNGYARQLGLRYTIVRVQELLVARPALVRALVTFFEAKFDPALPAEGRAAAVAAASEAVIDLLRDVEDHDQDMVFRTLHNLIESSLRTNFYRDDKVAHYLSFKIDAAKVKSMPSPRLMVEIYVHHREVEGIHIRGGRVARGGIRWSDREDYRREVMDLVSTQMLKNVLIVPEGAKGGFFLKRPPAAPAERRREADRLYQMFIRGLLDLTDNYAPDGKVGPPPRVVRHDGDDPYLVVAADKGTAHLSDTANRLSQAYGFWLDDAFASGGSNGYDHKKVGITARGGWMTVRRHMKELGIDPTRQVFTAVGVGDTAGDVFGNGVIEHPTMKLVAAFNHSHVFFDPDPDPATSFAERKRLFDEVKGWESYNTATLSPGGRIYSRRAKSLALTPEIKALLGVLQDELPVDVVIRLILRLNVDLLWNGGIGTYVKATHETHQDAGDPTNDDLRVNASELRCKMVGEGGNLGLTQAGRIEYALGGGRINTDAIDNSGGVDMSDHEVNLKILLNRVEAAGRLSREDRNTLLEAMTDEVADCVLANNERHGLQLSLDHTRGVLDPVSFAGAIDWVTRRGNATRAALRLPTDDDLARRKQARLGLTRPELATIQAHVKLHVFKDLIAADPRAVPGFDDAVQAYFPARIRAAYGDDVQKHMLHTSIGMTVVMNDCIGDAGAALFPLLLSLTGARPERVLAAWVRAWEVADGATLKAALLGPEVPVEAGYRAWVAATTSMATLCALWCAAGEPGEAHEDRAAITEALALLPTLKGTEIEARLAARAEPHSSRGVPAPLAMRVAALGKVTLAREAVLARRAGESLSDALVRTYAVGDASRLLHAIRALEARPASGGADGIAMGILRTRFVRLLRSLVAAVPIAPDVLALGLDRVTTRLNREDLRDLQSLMDGLLGESPDVAALLVAEERVRGWITAYEARVRGA